MHPGQPVEIKLDPFPHHPLIGRVDSISPAPAQFALLPPDNATGQPKLSNASLKDIQGIGATLRKALGFRHLIWSLKLWSFP